MIQENTILGLLAQTSIHAGTGQNTGIIDLPIQREGHNGWPCIFGSAVKGAIRSRAEEPEKDGKRKNVDVIFGPQSNSGTEYASAIMISDARLVLLPVRSLTSQFKWVTCPAALQRLEADMERFGFKVTLDLNSLPDIEKDQAYAPSTDTTALYLEEYRFKLEQHNFDKYIQLLSQLMNKAGAKEALTQQLVLVSNDMFSHLAQSATPVNAHIKINNDTKTVNNGSLWYEETLPPETLLYVGMSAADARNGDASCPASVIMDSVTDLFKDKPWLQLGGNETVGMGWCSVADYRKTKEG